MKKKLFAILLAFSLFHSLITISYNLPITPLKEKFNPLIYQYMHPLFAQTWMLFAPNPASTNINFEVKVTHGENEETKWINFTELIQDKSQRNFFSFYQFYAGALVQMNSDALVASGKIISDLNDEMKKDLESVDKNGYVNDLIEKEEIESFLIENPSVNSLIGFIYEHLENYYYNDITNIQVRISSEYYSEYGKEEDSKYVLSYLPNIEISQLIK